LFTRGPRIFAERLNEDVDRWEPWIDAGARSSFSLRGGL